MEAVPHVGRLDARQKLDQILLSVSSKCQLLENSEMTAVRNVMLEEHARFCFFVECLQPLMVNTRIFSVLLFLFCVRYLNIRTQGRVYGPQAFQ